MSPVSRVRRRIAIGVAVLAVGLGRFVAARAAEVADLVLWNGKIITVDAADSIAEAVAVSDGAILEVGSDSAMRAFIGPATRAVSLNGKTATPGLIDSHTHLIYYGQAENDYLNLRPPAATSTETGSSGSAISWQSRG